MQTALAPLTFIPSAGRPQLGLPINLTPLVEAMLARNAVVAIGVSGGKDSQAVAIATWRHLDAIGHTGPRVLVHSDLGVVEWKESLPVCERLAEHLGAELLVVRRQAGDMMDRWEGRWHNNVIRYNDLSCVKLILPWSTPSQRFCTSELKSSVIASELRKRFPKEEILNVTGIRRQESANRAKMPVAKEDTRLMRKNATGVAWNAIIDWDIEQVFQVIAAEGLELHEAYTVYGASRVSCAYCIMSAAKDLIAAAACLDNHDVFRRMVELEARSTFSFQGGKWLGDSSPHLLGEELRATLEEAKRKAVIRENAEKLLPKHLLYVKGWPVLMPTPGEADLIAEVRRTVSATVGLQSQYLTGESVLARYDELMLAKAMKEAAEAREALRPKRGAKALAAVIEDEQAEELEEMVAGEAPCG